MSDKQQVISSWFARVWNAGDESAVTALMAPTAKFHGMPTEPGGPLAGPASFLPYFRMFRRAFPDIHIDVLRMVSQGDIVAAHCRVTGTHTGPGIVEKATGRAVAFEGMVFTEVRNGQIQEGWNCFDAQTLYTQLGHGETAAADRKPETKSAGSGGAVGAAMGNSGDAGDARVGVVQALYKAFFAGDVEGLMALLADDVTFELPAMPGVPLATVYRGKAGVRQFLADRAVVLTYNAFTPGRFLADRDQVIVVGETAGTVNATGKPFGYKWVQLFEVTPDRRVRRFHEFMDTHALVKAFAG